MTTKIDLIREAERFLTLAQDHGDMLMANVLTRAIAGESVCLAAVVALLAAEQAVRVALEA